MKEYILHLTEEKGLIPVPKRHPTKYFAEELGQNQETYYSIFSTTTRLWAGMDYD